MICIPKDEGGLGVIDIEKQNQSSTAKEFTQDFQQVRHPLGSSHLGEALP